MTHFQSNTGVNRAIFVKNKPKHTVNVTFSSNICSQWQDASFFFLRNHSPWVPGFISCKTTILFLESGFKKKYTDILMRRVSLFWRGGILGCDSTAKVLLAEIQKSQQQMLLSDCAISHRYFTSKNNQNIFLQPLTTRVKSNSQ